MTCPTAPDELVEARIDRVLTQYRESPKLLHVMRTTLRQVEEAYSAICDLPSFFDIDTAIGDQLTLIGKRLGWPRCHCVCTITPAFGFACEGFATDVPVVGFCESGTWEVCGLYGNGEVCIEDDEIYRGFLRARRYQILSFYDIESLTDALQAIWGPTATVLDAGLGRVVLAPGRALDDIETSMLQIVPRVLPVAPGIRQRYHFGAIKVFGFGDGWGGFCDEWLPDGLPLAGNGDTELIDDDEAILVTGPLYRDAPWMCAIDLKPYECA